MYISVYFNVHLLTGLDFLNYYCNYFLSMCFIIRPYYVHIYVFAMTYTYLFITHFNMTLFLLIDG